MSSGAADSGGKGQAPEDVVRITGGESLNVRGLTLNLYFRSKR
jgi:hypothetical protein